MTIRSVRSVYLVAAISLLALLAAAVQFALAPARANAQASPGVEIRLAARENHDGSVSVSLQYRLDGSWLPVTPTRNRLPATQPGRWYVTNALDIEVAQAQVEIGVLNRSWSDQAGPDQFIVAVDDTQFRTRCGLLHLKLDDDGLIMQSGAPDCEDSVVFGERQLANPTGVGSVPIRIAARRVGGGVELGIQRLVRGRWEALRQPSNPLLRDGPQDRWRFSDTFSLPAQPPHVSGQLRRGAAITTRDGEFVLDIDGRTYRTHCGILNLHIVTEHILVDTSTEDCHRSAALLTLCPTSDCDEQQNAAYEWEYRQIGTSLFAIELTLSQAKAVVNALFADYFPRANPPSVSFSDEQSHGHWSWTEHEIVLGTNAQNLGYLVHELAHALVDQSGPWNVGHGGAFTAMLLDVWERYFPIVDISAAHADARRAGIEIASQPPARAVSARATETLTRLFCGSHPVSEVLCQSFASEMPQVAGGSVDGQYVESGRRGDDLWWGMDKVDDSNKYRTYIAAESREYRDNGSVARLQLACNTDDRLEVRLWWRERVPTTSLINYRFGDGGWRDEHWGIWNETGTWGEDQWGIHGALDASDWLQLMSWHARVGNLLSVRSGRGSNTLTASFDLTGVFNTPAQPRLTTCGNNWTVDAGPVIDWGGFGDNFFWGVDQDENPLQSYVVSDTTIDGSNREARLSMQCQDGGLEIDLYWDVGHDLDWTVRYRINNDGWHSGEWHSGQGSWGNAEYKWTGLKQADDLIAQLAWGAQSGGTFTAAVRERDNASRRYAATWSLDRLFETPIQPNLARCGR